METYQDRIRILTEALRRTAGEPVSLGKDTSNLFRRRRDAERGGTLNVRNMHNVLALDADAGWVEVEGMTSYESLLDATLPHGCMPAVVPQLKSITIGGAVSGIGIESSSFRYGLPHETVLEMDVLLGHGDVLTCTATNEHRDLFLAMPNSYGTLGYITRLKVATIAVKPFVQLTHIAVKDPREYFATIEKWCESDADFVDGVVFDEGDHYVTIGRFVEHAPYCSDYTYRNIYYRSIRERTVDYLTVKDYIWRWDTDWFWCSKTLFAQNPLVRRMLGKKRLNSTFYTKVMRYNNRWGITRKLNRLLGKQPESVIQDVDIPIENAPAFLEFFQAEIGIRPAWICPIGHHRPELDFALYPLDTDRLFVNFGFWDSVPNHQGFPGGHFNRLIEDKVKQLGGIKSLYSDVYYSEEEFWRLYNGPAYQVLKARYDPCNRLRNLYDKCAARHAASAVRESGRAG
jgi:FAD/FMN-containing dehydrogenase